MPRPITSCFAGFIWPFVTLKRMSEPRENASLCCFSINSDGLTQKKSHAKLCTLIRNEYLTIMKELGWENIWERVTGDLHSEQQLVGTPSCFRPYGAISSNSLQGPIPEMIRSRSAPIRSCDPDQPITFHKRQSRPANQIEKIRNQTVYCQLNHDINHSLGNLSILTSQWEVWRRYLRVPIRERHRQFSARTQCLLTVQHGLDMPNLTGMCMWLTSLKIHKLLTQGKTIFQ